MIKDRAWDRFTMVVLVLLAAAFLPKVFLADSVLYTRYFTVRVLLLLGSPLKILFLGLGLVFAARVFRGFEKGNPVRRAWFWMTAGFLGFLLGQCGLALYQIVFFVPTVPTPYPSVADPFFVFGSLCFMAALCQFVDAYKRVGFPVGEVRELLVLIPVLLLIFAAIGTGILWPIWDVVEAGLGTVLDTTYIVLDFLILIPGLVLLRMAYLLRGGFLGKVWIHLMFGFFCIAVADILAAYFSLTGNEILDPILDLMFAYGYIFLARGCRSQILVLDTGIS